MNPESMLTIQSLIYKYAERIDAGDYPGIGELFKYGKIVTDSADPAVEGADAVKEMYENSTRLYPDGTPKSKHLTTNIIIEIADDDKSAKTRSYFTVLQKTENLSLQPIITGRYHDTFKRVSQDNENWHFVKRMMMVDQIGDLSQHLLFDITEDLS